MPSISSNASTVAAVSYPTPHGPLSVLAVDDEVVAAGFVAPEELVVRLPHPGHASVVRYDKIAFIDNAIAAYLAGDFAPFERLAVRQSGTEFQQLVWQALRSIPAGETRTYGEIAATIGRPNAVRAVGSACGRNLIAPFVPCHRALRSDGSLGGYYYGLDIKRWLLAHEQSNVLTNW